MNLDPPDRVGPFTATCRWSTAGSRSCCAGGLHPDRARMRPVFTLARPWSLHSPAP